MKSIGILLILALFFSLSRMHCEETVPVVAEDSSERADLSEVDPDDEIDEKPEESADSKEKSTWNAWIMSFFWNETPLAESEQTTSEEIERELHGDIGNEDDEAPYETELLLRNSVSIRPKRNVKRILIVTIVIIVTVVSLATLIRVYFASRSQT